MLGDGNHCVFTKIMELDHVGQEGPEKSGVMGNRSAKERRIQLNPRRRAPGLTRCTLLKCGTKKGADWFGPRPCVPKTGEVSVSICQWTAQ